jgi:hypothetical protein
MAAFQFAVVGELLTTDLNKDSTDWANQNLQSVLLWHVLFELAINTQLKRTRLEATALSGRTLKNQAGLDADVESSSFLEPVVGKICRFSTNLSTVRALSRLAAAWVSKKRTLAFLPV